MIDAVSSLHLELYHTDGDVLPDGRQRGGGFFVSEGMLLAVAVGGGVNVFLARRNGRELKSGNEHKLRGMHIPKAFAVDSAVAYGCNIAVIFSESLCYKFIHNDSPLAIILLWQIGIVNVNIPYFH